MRHLCSPQTAFTARFPSSDLSTSHWFRIDCLVRCHWYLTHIYLLPLCIIACAWQMILFPKCQMKAVAECTRESSADEYIVLRHRSSLVWKCEDQLLLESFHFVFGHRIASFIDIGSKFSICSCKTDDIVILKFMVVREMVCVAR